MAETGFDRGRFDARLVTRRLGRALITRERTASTNDDVWAAFASGAPDGAAVVAADQTRGRGRAGRSWHMAPGKGLALSVLLRDGEGRALGVTPLLAGLALVRALERLGVSADLKWPNDVLLGGRKLAGLLAESRGDAATGGRAVVVGAGVNVGEEEGDFPPAVRDTAISLARAGCVAGREEVAAEFLNALEPLWDDLARLGPGPLVAVCAARSAGWGRTVRVAGPAGPVEGIARGLDEEGRLVVALADGTTAAIVAGDVEFATSPGPGGERGAGTGG